MYFKILDCNIVLSQVCSLRADLKDTPLTNPDLILFVDGSASRDAVTGKNNVGFAVIHIVLCVRADFRVTTLHK